LSRTTDDTDMNAIVAQLVRAHPVETYTNVDSNEASSLATCGGYRLRRECSG
jgi:hypothetical protein